MKRLVPLFALACLALLGAATFHAASVEHITLLASAPAKDTVLQQPPTEIRLWFSGVPRASSTTIQLLDVTDNPVTTVHIVEAAPDPQDGKVQFAEIHGTLAAGRYTVGWEATADDGEEAAGRYSFTVRMR